MAEIDFPHDIIRYPKDSGFSRERVAGFIQSDLSGAPYNRRQTHDRPTFINISWTLEKGRAQALRDFIEDELDGGVKPFNIYMETEGGWWWQEARFTADGLPQLTQVNASSFNYSARIVIRNWNNEADPVDIELANYAAYNGMTVDEMLLDIDEIVNLELP